MTDLLTRVVAYKREEIAAAEKERPLSELRRKALAADPPRGFIAAIERRHQERRYALIAELKKRSPSAGLIRERFVPSDLARAYEAGGAACLSVLTDGPFFEGSFEHLASARAATALPVLCKDFIIDPYQVVQARVWGADAILLMLSLVDDETAKVIERTAEDLGMAVLVEVHDTEELERARLLRSRLIGVNNRNLKTMTTTLTTAESLAPHIPSDRIPVAESGLGSPADLARMAAVGFSTFLIGERLLRNDDVEAATRTLLAT